MKSAGWAKASDEGEESGQGKVFPGRRPPANSDLVGLQRDRIDNLNGGVLGVDLLGKPIAGLLVTVGEHDGAGGGLKGELEEFFAIDVAAELEAFDAGVDFSAHVNRFEHEVVAVFGDEEFTAGGVGVAVADEADGIAGMAEKAGGEGVARGVFDQHARADDVEGAFFGIHAGFQVAGKRL